MTRKLPTQEQPSATNQWQAGWRALAFVVRIGIVVVPGGSKWVVVGNRRNVTHRHPSKDTGRQEADGITQAHPRGVERPGHAVRDSRPRPEPVALHTHWSAGIVGK